MKTTAKAAATLCFCICASSCARYGDFRLPAPGEDAKDVAWTWRAEPAPVLEPRAGEPRAGEIDLLNPTVANGQLFYSLFDGKTWHTALSGARVLSPQGGREGDYIAANGHIEFIAGEYCHWYQSGPMERPEIFFARSKDGRNWQRHGPPVLSRGPFMAWDEQGVADPYVIRRDGMFYLFFLGQDRARRQRLGVATSRDGIAWIRLRANPVLALGAPGTWDENGLGEPAVWASDGTWWMLYTGRARSEVRRIGMAKSRDGVSWEKLATPVIEGDQPWNSKVVCDPHVEPQSGGSVKVWFGGGDVAHPAERINGRIGVGWLSR